MSPNVAPTARRSNTEAFAERTSPSIGQTRLTGPHGAGNGHLEPDPDHPGPDPADEGNPNYDGRPPFGDADPAETELEDAIARYEQSQIADYEKKSRPLWPLKAQQIRDKIETAFADDNDDRFNKLEKRKKALTTKTTKQMSWRKARLSLIDGQMPQGQIALSFGESGTFKTAIALDAALRIVFGMKWFDTFPVTCGCVLYVASEAPESVEARTLAWLQYHEKPHTDRFVIMPHVVDMMTTDDAIVIVHRIADLIERCRAECVLVIIDTLAQSMEGDENSSDMSAFMRQCAKICEITGASVWIQHHTSKADKSRPRGFSGVENASPYRFRLEKEDSLPPGGPPSILFARTHGKDGRPAAPFRFRPEVVTLKDDNPDGATAEIVVVVPDRQVSDLDVKIGKLAKTSHGRDVAELWRSDGFPDIDRDLADALLKRARPKATNTDAGMRDVRRKVKDSWIKHGLPWPA